jgi:endonuclease YncB( thermonuclease family)
VKRMPRWVWVVAAALLVWVVASPSESEERPRDESTERQADREPGSTSGERTNSRRDRDADRAEPERDHGSRQASQQAPRTWVVTEVIDGDTVDLGNGERVRLVGIDTPERGECGYEKAADALSTLVLGRQVELVRSDEDRDQYDRLLRYVDVDGVDTGLALVRRGLAISRYDSRDGYGFHPREPQYVAADRGSKPVCPTRPLGFAGTSQQGGCAPGYAPCVPAFPPDVDCADVGGPVTVSGTDPHGLDGDGDGTACE